MENGVAYKDGLEVGNSDLEEEGAGDTATGVDLGVSAVQVTTNTASEAIVINSGEPPSSANGCYSASYSSGIGTCSYVSL